MFYKIRDLGVISDRRSGAVIAKNGDVCWYCPRQFDNPSLFASLLDSKNGGVWSVNPGKTYNTERKYIDNSSILETRFHSGTDEFKVTDWMPLQDDFFGICRLFSTSTVTRENILTPAPGYGQDKVQIRKMDNTKISINNNYFLMLSHPARVEDRKIVFEVPANEEGWAVLAINLPYKEEFKPGQTYTMNGSYRGLSKLVNFSSITVFDRDEYEQNH
ncbi:MAG: trehalase-like domain-containing protein [Bacteroidota bacterium]